MADSEKPKVTEATEQQQKQPEEEQQPQPQQPETQQEEAGVTPANTFANDGSFLEKFKKLQEEAEEKKKKDDAAERLV